MPAPVNAATTHSLGGCIVAASGAVEIQGDLAPVETVCDQDESPKPGNALDHDDSNAVEAFEKLTKWIQNPVFVKSATKEQKTGGFFVNLNLSSIHGSGSNKVVPDPAGSSSSPIGVPVVPAACYAITEVDTEVLPGNPQGFRYNHMIKKIPFITLKHLCNC